RSVADLVHNVTLLDKGIKVWSVAYLPDGEHVLTASEDGQPRLWNIKEGRIEKTYRLSGQGVGYAAVSPDGKQALSDTRLLWDVSTGETIGKLSVPGYGARAVTIEIAFSPDGRRALTGLMLWDMTTGRPIRTFNSTEAAGRIVFSPDGKLALSALGPVPNAVQVWDVQTGAEVRRFEGHGA